MTETKKIEFNKNGTILATDKYFAFDYYNKSIVVMDLLLQSHSNFKTPFPINKNKALLDLAFADVVKELKKTYVPKQDVLDLEIEYSVDVLDENYTYAKDSGTGSIVQYSEQSSSESQSEQENMFVNVLNIIYNNFVKLMAEFITETSNTPLESYTPKDFKRAENIKYELVASFSQDSENELYKQLFKFYDEVMHSSYEDIEHHHLGGHLEE